MKKIAGIITALYLLCMTSVVHAALTTIGTATYKGKNYKLIWDDDNNGNSVIWLDFSNDVLPWQDQMDWAAGLDSDLSYNIDAAYNVTWDDFGPGSLDDPVTYLPEFELTHVGDNRYERSYDNFDMDGAYVITVYAQDTDEPISEPMPVRVLKNVEPGDINGDGDVGIADAILALRILTGMEQSDTVIKEADVNGDDSIGLAEALYIMQHPCGTPVFASTPILLPDLRAKYDSLCGDEVGSHLTIANLSGHSDGKKDLLIQLWCGQSPVGEITSAPTLNGMVIIKQRRDGTFYDATKEMFDTEIIDLGGVAGRYSVVYDLNNDGYDEVVLPITGEDGRAILGDDPSTWNNKQAVFLTSNGGGGYTIEQLGWASYGMRADLVDSPIGSKDIITTVIGYGGKAEAWHLSGNVWSTTNTYDSLSNYMSGLYFSEKSASSGSDTHIVATSTKSLALFKKASSGIWQRKSDWSFPNPVEAPFQAWNGQQGVIQVVNINGADFTFVSFVDYCELQRNPSDNPIAMYLVPASEIVGGYSGEMIIESTPQLQWHMLLMGFSAEDDSLSPVDIPLTNEIYDKPPFKFECTDINNDDYEDMIIPTWGAGAKPIVYLNDHEDGFSSVNENHFPSGSSDFRDSTMTLSDIDGDGIPDLLIRPLNGLLDQTGKVQYEVYRGNRFMNSTDTE